MTLWTAIVLACAATYLTKLAGYAVPARWLQNPRMARVAGAITVALLSALTVMNTFAAGTALVIDARLAALGVAALALWLRLPFLLVVVLGAAAAGVVGVRGCWAVVGQEQSAGLRLNQRVPDLSASGQDCAATLR